MQIIDYVGVVTVVWDGMKDVRVDITPKPSTQVCGICGSPDGYSNNDMIVGPQNSCLSGLPIVPEGTQVLIMIIPLRLKNYFCFSLREHGI